MLANFIKSVTEFVFKVRACYLRKLTTTMGLLLAVSIGSFLSGHPTDKVGHWMLPLAAGQRSRCKTKHQDGSLITALSLGRSSGGNYWIACPGVIVLACGFNLDFNVSSSMCAINGTN